METLHPGLYVQEVQGTPPMEGVSTSTGAFLGTAPKGDVEKAVFITSWAQYVAEFGGYIEKSYLAYAVKGFFDNGGKRCYVKRVVHLNSGQKTSAEASLMLKESKDSSATVVAKVVAKSDGEWGNKISVQVARDSSSQKFSITVFYSDAIVETFGDLEPSNVEEIIKSSKYIDYVKMDDVKIPIDLDKTTLSGGKDGIEGIVDSDFLGDSATKSGLHAFDGININLLAVPSVTSTAVLKGVISYAESRQDCLAILDTPKGQTPTQVSEFVKKTANLSSDYSAIYYPWLQVNDPIGVGKNPIKAVPPSGHVMGVIARMDSKIGCWRAPAGTDAKVLGVVNLERDTSDNEQDLLNPDCINCIRSFEGEGIIVWGARTLSKGEFKYIPVRRVSMFIEKSITANLRWTVFKPNDKDLWDASKNAVENFLTGLWSQGGLKGATSKEAFFVVCDETINTKEAVDEGKMHLDLGISPLKPAEFVIFRLSLKR